MPAETHQRGWGVRPDEVVELLCAVLDGVTADEAGSVSLAAVGVDEEGLAALWDTVCEELAERDLGPELQADGLKVSMTLVQAANVLSELLHDASGNAS
ncbi:MAG: hypothetical protein M0029_13090 [Actinomycetota bacterium]|jgi:hypothetical protein|nr:hypothetical protein [Actinomycetota bacterium]